jgi:hypothetical protein
MSANKKIPEFTRYEEMEEFCDTQDLGESWEQTEPAECEISPQARCRSQASTDRTFQNPELKGTPGIELMTFAGIMRPEEAEGMLQAIAQDCRKIDLEEW